MFKHEANRAAQPFARDPDRTTDTQVAIAIILEPREDNTAPAAAIEFTLHERLDDVAALFDKLHIYGFRQSRVIANPHDGVRPGVIAKYLDPVAHPVFAL